jgi:hypothetical protein
MTTPGQMVVDEAFRAFDRWLKEYDPDGNMEICDAVVSYSEWCKKNSIEKYLDAAQGN